MKKICLLLLLLPLTAAATAPRFADRDEPITAVGLLQTGFLNPALLGFDTSLQFSYMTDYLDSTFGSAHLLSFRWGGAGIQISTDSINGTGYQKAKFGFGYHWRSAGVLIGAGVSRFFSDDGFLDKLRLLDLGFSKFISEHFLLSMTVTDVVLSRSAGGYAEPEYSFGVGINLFDGRVALHGSFSLSGSQSVAESGKSLSLCVVPFSGISTGLQYRYHDGAGSFGVSFDISLDRIRAGTTAAFDKDQLLRSYARLEYRSRPAHSLLPSGGKVLTVDIAGSLPENPVTVKKIFNSVKKPSYLDLLLTLQQGVFDRSVSGLYLRLLDTAFEYARVEELAGVIRQYRKYGKSVTAYIEDGSQRSYLLASEADYIVINPAAELRFRGAGAAITFLKGFLDSVGIKAELFYRGPYKGTPQQLTGGNITPEVRSNQQQVLNSLQQIVQHALQQSPRRFSPALVRQLFLQGSWTPVEAVSNRLADAAGYSADAEIYLRSKGLQPVLWQSYAEDKRALKSWGTKPEIAVVHVTGSIVNGSGSGSMPVFMPEVSGADTVCGSLQRLGADPVVRAVVLRVNSPGGDLLASDKIWRSVTRLAEHKPVIVSFGAVAASGGYYLAAGSAAQRVYIVAPKSCLTGSIGVFTGKITYAELKKKLGMTTAVIRTGPHSLAGSGGVAYNDASRKAVLRMLDYWYARFTGIVRNGRGLTVSATEAAAGGRIWTGADARRLGLIDRFGSLLDAIKIAGEKAGLKDAAYRVGEYPGTQISGLIPGAAGYGTLFWRRFLQQGNLGALILNGKPLAHVPWTIRFF